MTLTGPRVRLTAAQHRTLYEHLFPGDGLEAVAFVLCGRSRSDAGEVLMGREVQCVPYKDCQRQRDLVEWKPTWLVPLLERAQANSLGLLKVHSHPSGYDQHSETDDASDKRVFDSISAWIGDGLSHASAVMLPDGRLVTRFVLADGRTAPALHTAIVGDDLQFWPGVDAEPVEAPEFARRHAQLFGTGTTNLLRRLAFGVVGCSGTGSVIVEQLARLGVGRLVLVDPDKVERKNLNRILNATADDARRGLAKTQVLKRAILSVGLGTEVVTHEAKLMDASARRAIAGCDVVFGCMDSQNGRGLLNRLTVFHALPHIDLGVKLKADGEGGIDECAGAVHYLRPDGSSLLERGVISAAGMRAEDLLESDPDEFRRQRGEGYIVGVNVDRPAVVAINSLVASLAVSELLARVHPYRNVPNAEFGIVIANLMENEVVHMRDEVAPTHLVQHVGKGDVRPPLGLPALEA